MSLAATYIQSTMNATLTGSEPGLVGYWPFDEGSGGTTADLTANGDTGILGGGVPADEPTWVASTAPVSTVNIDLMQNGNVVSNIATGVANNGQYLWSIPAGTTPGSYSIRVTWPNAGLAGTSLAPFTITAPVHVYYVNDGTVLSGDWTTEPGSDANDGLTPATPKASIQGVLAAYNLGPGDVIEVDDGTYNLATNILLAVTTPALPSRATTIPRIPTRAAVVSRGNTNSGQYVFQLTGAQNVTLSHLAITGGYEGIYAASGEDSTGLTVSNCTIYGNSYIGADVETSNNNATFSGDTVYGQSYGLYLSSVNNALLSGNTVYGNSSWGIEVYSGVQDVASANNAYANAYGIYVSGSGSGTAQQSQASGNTVHDNSSVGIAVSGDALAVGNTAYRQMASGAYGLEVQSGAVAQQNVVHDNYYGIYVYNSSQALNNRVYNNSQIGINAAYASTIQGNTVYSNGVGLQLSSGYSQVSNNLIYANVNQGILANGPYSTQITNNTIYQPVGDAIRIQSSASSLSLENNILWVQAGYDLYITPDSEQGFFSDYNDLYSTATGKLGSWEGRDFTGPTALADWILRGGPGQPQPAHPDEPQRGRPLVHQSRRRRRHPRLQFGRRHGLAGTDHRQRQCRGLQHQRRLDQRQRQRIQQRLPEEHDHRRRGDVYLQRHARLVPGGRYLAGHQRR